VKKFVNEEMAAPNVLRVPIDLAITEQLGPIIRSKAARLKLYSQAPLWRSNVRWYSARFKRDFRRFRSVFDRLDVARHVEPYLDFTDEVRLYNGFLVIRSNCTEPNFHVDWRDANNEAFTLLTPLTANCSGFGLLYKRIDGTVGEYDYKLGEALIFGDDFVHSTKPGIAEKPVVLLCFNFGTDKMEHWSSIERTAAHQSLLICLPSGEFQRLPVAKRMRNLLASILRITGLRRPQMTESGY
jgi:hypothetical protein